jgi:LacI family transcriptional regulator
MYMPQRRLNILLYVETHTSYGHGILRGISRYASCHERWRTYVFGWREIGDPLAAMSSADGVIAQFRAQDWVDAARSARGAVNVSTHAQYDLPLVAADNEAVGRMAAEHLLDRGLRHFGYCGVPDTRYSASRERGFVRAVEAASCTCSRILRSYADPNPIPLQQWLAALPKPAGVMAASDLDARHVSMHARDIGVCVPEQLAVIGVDNDVSLCELCLPPASSIALPVERIGYEAAALLDRLIEGEPPPTRPLLLPPMGVVTRRSTDVLAVNDELVAEAMRLIHEGIGRGVDVDDVLSVVNVSRKTLELRFNRALGRSPGSEIRRVRLERTKRLLSETSSSMPEIASAAGWSTAKQLCETFRRETGFTPSAYRRQSQFRSTTPSRVD